MKKIILLIFFLFNNNLFGNIYCEYYSGMYTCSYDFTGPVSQTTQYACAYMGDCFIDSKGYEYTINNKFYISEYKNSLNLNLTCFNDLFNTAPSWRGCSNIRDVSILIDYCKSHGSNYVYSTVSHAWIKTDTGEILCPEGQRYNSSTEQCEDIPQCPTGSELDNLAKQKCKSLDFVKNEDCNISTGEPIITCKTCDEVLQMLSDYCLAHDGTLKDGSYSCNQNADGSLNINFSSDFNVSMCEYPNNDNNSTTDNSSGSDYTDNNNSNVDNTNENNSTNNSSDSGSSGSNSDNNSNNENNNNSNNNINNSNNSNNTCPDPCYLYNHKPMGFQTSQTIVDGYTCYTITYPTYDNCILKYHTLNGSCVVGCGDTGVSSVNNSDINITLDTTPITSRIDKTNEKLDSIDQKLDDFKNMKPESNSSQYDGSIITKALDQYSKASDNVKNDFNSIKSKFNELKTLFDSNKKMDLSVSGPDSSNKCFELEIWGEKIDFDLCSPLKILSPILTFVVSLILNIFLIMFAVKHMFKE